MESYFRINLRCQQFHKGKFWTKRRNELMRVSYLDVLIYYCLLVDHSNHLEVSIKCIGLKENQIILEFEEKLKATNSSKDPLYLGITLTHKKFSLARIRKDGLQRLKDSTPLVLVVLWSLNWPRSLVIIPVSTRTYPPFTLFLFNSFNW